MTNKQGPERRSGPCFFCYTVLFSLLYTSESLYARVFSPQVDFPPLRNTMSADIISCPLKHAFGYQSVIVRVIVGNYPFAQLYIFTSLYLFVCTTQLRYLVYVFPVYVLCRCTVCYNRFVLEQEFIYC